MTSDEAIAHRLLQNSLVLENICLHLPFKDHLTLMDTCEEFRDTLVNFIWRSLCKELIVTERNDNYLLQLNGTDYCLREKNFIEFLSLNILNVKQLQLRNCVRNDLLSVLEQFQNLTFLEFQYCQVSNANMEAISTNCLSLGVLIFDRCMQCCHSEIVLDRDIKISTLARFPVLKELSLFNRYKVKMNYETIQKVFKKLRLSKLIINTTIIYEGSHESNNKALKASAESLQCLTHLDIGRFSNRGSWTNFIKMHLPHFRNLTTLSIFIDLANCVLINDAVLETICTACVDLRELTFKQSKFQVLHFSLPANLEHLSLEWCWGITWQNLRCMLTQNKLKSFTSINGHFNGDDIDFFYCADSLETFTLETSLIKDITSILFSSKSKFPKVYALNWLNSSESCHTHPLEIRSGLSDVFPKLQQLRLEQSYLCIIQLQQLVHLKVLQFSLFYHMTWSYLFDLLFSTTLTHLTIDMPSYAAHLSSVCPILNIKTHTTSIEPVNSMEHIKIPLEVFQNGLGFWLDCLNRNKKLKILFYINYSYKIFNQKLINDILSHDKFPCSRRSIKICNKRVDCDDLRKNFGKTMNRFEFPCNSMGQYFIEI